MDELERSINLVAVTSPDLQMPKVIIHRAPIVHTPVGSASSGMICWQPDTNARLRVFGFVGTDLSIGNYFGPPIFAGIPFEKAPVLKASIDIYVSDNKAYSKSVVGSYPFKVEMSDFSNPC